MKKLIEKLIRFRNPDFRFDPQLSPGMLLSLSLPFVWGQIRALRLAFSGKNPLKRFLGRGVRLQVAGRIHLGPWVKIGEQTFLSAFGSEGLQFFTKNNCIGTSGFHEFHFLRGQGTGNINQFLALAIV